MYAYDRTRKGNRLQNVIMSIRPTSIRTHWLWISLDQPKFSIIKRSMSHGLGQS